MLLSAGVSLKHWEVLKPTDAELNQGLLTQLGGLAILSSTGDIKYQHIDQGICNVSSKCVFTCIEIFCDIYLQCRFLSICSLNILS